MLIVTTAALTHDVLHKKEIALFYQGRGTQDSRTCLRMDLFTTLLDVRPALIVRMCPLRSWKSESKITRKKIISGCYFCCDSKRPSIRWALSVSQHGIASPQPLTVGSTGIFQ